MPFIVSGPHAYAQLISKLQTTPGLEGMFDNNFMMDFENYCLKHYWHKTIPTGPQRCENAEWAQMMKEQCKDSDLDYDKYCAWVKQGGGDECGIRSAHATPF